MDFRGMTATTSTPRSTLAQMILRVMASIKIAMASMATALVELVAVDRAAVALVELAERAAQERARRVLKR